MLNVSPKPPQSDATPAVPPPEPVSVPTPTPWSPAALTAPRQADASRSRLRWSTPFCFSASLLTLLLAALLGALRTPEAIVVSVAIAGVVLFLLTSLIALVRGLLGIAALVGAATGRADVSILKTLGATLGNFLMAGLGAYVAWLATYGFARGRQLRRFGKVLLPGLRPDPAWASDAVRPHVAEPPPAGLADQWRENGKTEHASVAAFARLTLDLMALGAPPSLIAAANRDALDEIRHTELCFSLARGLDGRAVSPASFPEAQRVAPLPRSRTLALAKLAVDSLVDGALHEGVSARVIAKLARRCEVPEIGAALKEIAADEGRHAAHGWSVVEWCLDEGGAPVAGALAGATRALPKEMRSALPEPVAGGGWERWGIHGHALEAEEYAAALAHLIRRVEALVAGRARPAA